MELYINPDFEVINLVNADIITTSGTETPLYDETDGIWNSDIGAQ